MIAFDVVFPEPDRLNPDIAADTFRNLDEATRDKLRALPSNDQVFADAIRSSRVVLGESGGPDVHPELDRNLPVTGLAMLGEDPVHFMPQFPGLLRNIPVIEEAAAGRGLFTVVPERDGIVRRVPTLMQAQGIIMPSLNFEMLRVASGSGTILIKVDKEGIRASACNAFRSRPTRTASSGCIIAHHDPSIYVSAVDVLEGRVAQDKIAGKLVLIGTSATGLVDIKTTPVEPVMPGVEIHAQVLETALTGATLTQPNWAAASEFIVAILLGLAVIAFTPQLGAVTLVVVGGGVRVSADRHLLVLATSTTGS